MISNNSYPVLFNAVPLERFRQLQTPGRGGGGKGLVRMTVV